MTYDCASAPMPDILERLVDEAIKEMVKETLEENARVLIENVALRTKLGEAVRDLTLVCTGGEEKICEVCAHNAELAICSEQNEECICKECCETCACKECRNSSNWKWRGEA